MTSPTRRPPPTSLLVLGLVLASLASPALAQTSSVGGNIGSFIQMPPHQLLVLRANMPPVRGVKITYWREPVFRRRITAAPVPPIHPGVANRGASPPPAPPPSPSAPDRYADLRLTPLAQTDLPPLRPGEVTPDALRRWTEAAMRQGRAERDQADRGTRSKT